MSFQTCGFCMVSVKSKIRFFFSFCSICMAFFHLMNNNAKKWQKEQLSIIEDVCMIAVCFKPLFTPKHEVHIFQWNTLSRFSVNSFFSLYNSKGTWKMVHKLYWLLFIIFAWQLNIDFHHFHEKKKTLSFYSLFPINVIYLICFAKKMINTEVLQTHAMHGSRSPLRSLQHLLVASAEITWSQNIAVAELYTQTRSHSNRCSAQLLLSTIQTAKERVWESVLWQGFVK